MESASVLLLDLDPRDPLGPSFRCLAEEREGRFRTAVREVPLPGGRGSAGWEPARDLDGLTPDLLVLAAGSVPWEHARDVLRRLRGEDSGLPVLAALREWEPDPIQELLREGWVDFVTVPLRPLDLFPRLERLLSVRRREEGMVHRLKERLGMRRMVGMSPRFLEEVGKVPTIARCDASVLLSGETGTGKEMCARAIHYLSPRADKPFTGLNCGAVPADLIENELFGHEKEAFTGAATARPGLLRETEGGTLFLDEVDSLPPQAQVKLLRFLQEKEYRALGSSRTVKADVRVIAASNVDLESAVAAGRIRGDLYYRLNVVSLRLPPLRERRGDIPALLDHFLAKYGREYRAGPLEVAMEARKRLAAYAWPGNIRQLEHAVQRAVLLASGPVLGMEDFSLPGEGPGKEEPFGVAKARLIRDFEREYLETLLRVHQGNVSQAARTARKNRRAFWQLVQKHGIEVGRFRVQAGAVDEADGALA